jgi:uncharacterized SAM-binding protein YcdF (DUF218 family)
MAIVAAVAASCYAARGLILLALGMWLDVGERPQKADFIMILAGDENNRPYLAAALVRAGCAGKALVAKGDISCAVSEGIVPPADEIIRRVLLSYGTAAENIITLPVAAATTYDEARALANFLEKKTNSRVLIVTTHYHTRRARWIFSKILGDMQKISFVSAPTDKFQLATWWRNDSGSVEIISEYVKLMYYVICYGYGSYFLAGGVMLAILVVFYRRSHGKNAPTASSPLARPPDVTSTSLNKQST